VSLKFTMTDSRHYYIQVSDKQDTWHTTLKRVYGGTERYEVKVSALRRIRYFVSSSHIEGMDMRPTT
jgi:hypothetical protein